MPELKSCPFCGGEAETTTMPYDGKTLYFVGCESCFASVGMVPPDGFRGWFEQEQAIAAWNTRKGE